MVGCRPGDTGDNVHGTYSRVERRRSSYPGSKPTPGAVEFLDCRDYRAVAHAIRELKVRGAPAIGVTAAMGVALGAHMVTASDYDTFAKQVDDICDHLAASRPTAVNLFWAIARMKQKLAALKTLPIAQIKIRAHS